MRPAPLAVLLSCLAATPAFADEKPPPVTRATVYPDRSLLTRVLPVACSDRPEVVRFAGLPPGLDGGSLRATIAGGTGGRVDGVALFERVRKDPYGAEVRALDAELQTLQDRSAEQEAELERARALGAQAEGLRDGMAPFLTREAAAVKKPDLAAWKAGLDQTRETIDQAAARARAAAIALRDLSRKQEELTRKRGELAGAAPLRAFDVEVVARCAGGGQARLELSYLVPGATWRPVYEARADEAAGKIRLTVLAELYQATGEEWKNAAITLSTAISRRDSTPPEPQRLHLYAVEEEERKKVLVHGSAEIRHAERPQPGAAPSTGGDARALPAMDQGLSVQLEVPERADVPGDGRPVRLAVETIELPATFRLVTVPKLLPHVVREGVARNRARYPLLAGRVELFAGGGYLGAAELPRTAQGGELSLGFGIVDAVKVRRTVIDEERREPGLFSGSRKLAYGYRIELSSFGPKPVEVLLREHIPVSELDDVKVELGKETTGGHEHEKKDGVLTWKVKLEPNVPRTIELRFTVKVPEAYDSSAL